MAQAKLPLTSFLCILESGRIRRAHELLSAAFKQVQKPFSLFNFPSRRIDSERLGQDHVRVLQCKERNYADIMSRSVASVQFTSAKVAVM